LQIKYSIDILDSNKKYKIAIVANATWNIYNFRLNVLDVLLANNFEVYVIAPVDKYIFYKEDFPEVVHVPVKNLVRDGTNPVKEFFLIYEFVSIYKKINPDIILHYTIKPNIYGGIAAGILKIPSIAVVTGLGYAFIHRGIIQTVTRLLYRFSSKYHNKIIFENIDDLELFKKSKLIKAEKGISIKGCGVDIEYFSPIVKNGKNKNKIIFTFIGRLLYDKGVVEYVEAAKIVKKDYENAEFWLIGEIDKSNPAMVKEEDLINWVKNKTVIYHGFKQDIKRFISKSDCIVLPSYREGMPRTILEGLAMAKPVIATNTAGCREVIEEGKNGYLVPIKEINALAIAMKRIIDISEEGRIDIGNYGREKAIREFDDNLIADEILNIILDVLKTKE